ncbi:MAG: c-type heme family protein [Gemmatimonadaceae bacterium]
MSLLARVNVTLGIAFVLGVGVSGLVARQILQDEARKEGLETVQLMLSSAAANRDYTRDEIAPLLTAQMNERFLPQMVPAYSATRQIERFRVAHPDFVYREATLNPTNPEDRVTDWEADIVNRFRSTPALKEVTGERMTPSGLTLYMARPLTVSSATCLGCHSTADAAPATMTAKYGTVNGFGWQMNETIGSQIMSVPLSAALAKANTNFYRFMGALVAIFVLVFVLVNVMIRILVLRPIARMAAISDKVSNGDLSGPGFVPTGNDEIAQLARSFERMRLSLAKSVALLGGE